MIILDNFFGGIFVRVFFVKRVTLVLTAAILILGAALSIPVTVGVKQVSPETREYWNGSKDIIWHISTKEKMIAMIVKVSKEMGYRVIIWSWEQQSRVWANPGTPTIIRMVLKDASSGNIIVFHDRGGNRVQTVQAMQPIIDGFKLVTVSEMLRNSE
ncbi:MAG: hypothetical protein CVV03_06745 [Firmicutes bacterium HGW-Firmicutes-8]|nr:MAG: hypothetical protein CVV03_06745 [Firmicutes bacterium HGW-Firmicutes-8]